MQQSRARILLFRNGTLLARHAHKGRVPLRMIYITETNLTRYFLHAHVVTLKEAFVPCVYITPEHTHTQLKYKILLLHKFV